MGKLIRNHWARLVVMVAAGIEIGAAIEGFWWPKIFWDFSTDKLNPAVKPAPILQILNLVFGLSALAWEYPLSFIAGSRAHRSIEARLVVYPMFVLTSFLMYQSTNAAIYYLIGITIYFFALIKGESVCAEPWTLPKRAADSRPPRTNTMMPMATMTPIEPNVPMDFMLPRATMGHPRMEKFDMSQTSEKV